MKKVWNILTSSTYVSSIPVRHYFAIAENRRKEEANTLDLNTLALHKGIVVAGQGRKPRSLGANPTY